MRFHRRRLWESALGAMAAVAALLGVLGATAGANSGPSLTSPGPYQIRAASLTQDGQQLEWRVELAQPWGASRLAGERRSLCLLIERVGSGVVWGQACVIGPARRSFEPRLKYTPVNGTKTGSATIFSATVTRPNAEEINATFLPGAVDLRYGTIRWQTVSTLDTAACAPGAGSTGTGAAGVGAAADGGCSALYPPKQTLLKLHTPVLIGCVASGPSEVFQGPKNQHEIALTFDDGPWNDPPTVDFLRMLEREHVQATFFEIGDHIPMFDPDGALERRMLADGDMIGDHTWTHPVMTALSRSAQRAELVRTITAIRHATGFTPCLWRPPYGAIDPSLVALARSLGLLTIMWDIDPRDWSLPGVGAIYSNVVDHAHNGAIPIQHFGGGPRYQTLAAVPEEIATLRARGYKFVTVTQLLGLKLVYR